ncbi:oligosaccharide flippase family protein [Nocardioides speluncae]|uniref:oligosaccharide flippase family protein n=1 Tax=Nocardioides speluncae TaxID=2670337 RepID=UPI000D689D23|nr:oligosaccharide flippase family protein [Nocardioides speluncae]
MTTTESRVPATLEERRPEHSALGKQVGWGIALRLANIGVTAIIARILAPADFGVFAVALAVHVVVAGVAELGMASAVARSALEPDEIAPTVASISIGVSLLLGAAMVTFAGSIASVLGTPDAAEPIRILSLSLVIAGVFAVPGAQLAREFEHDKILMATVAGFVPANALLIGLALDGGGAAAFAWSLVAGQLVTGLVLVAALPRHYLPGWRRSVVGSLMRFGLPLALANLISLVLLNADYLIIARLLTETQIGVYMVAFSVAGGATAVLGMVLTGVVVPAFGRVADDRSKLADALVTSSGLVALVAMPIAFVTMGLSGPMVETLFGARWLDAGPVLTVLALHGLLFSFSLLYVNVLVATGQTARLLLIQVAWLAALAPAIVLGVKVDGLVGVAWAHVAVIALVAIPGYLWAVRRATGRPAAQLGTGLVGAVLHPMLAAVFAGLVAGATSGLFETAWIGFLAGGFAAVAAYTLVVWPALVHHVPTLAGRLPGTRRTPAGHTPAKAGRSVQSVDRRPRLAFGLEGLALGGCSINAIDLARTLRGRGQEVSIFAVEEDVQVSLIPYAEAAGFAVTTIPADVGLVGRARAIRRYADAHDADIVHVFAPGLGPAASVAVSGRSRRAAVMLNWTMENAFWTAPHTPMIVGTGAMRDEAEPLHGSQVWLLEPPVDLSRDRPHEEAAAAFRHDFGISSLDLLVVQVTGVDRVLQLSGILQAIDAVVRLDEAGDHSVRLAVVGDGDAMAEVQMKTVAANERLGRDAILLTGFLLDPHPAYAAADVALATGGSALRSLAHARPTIVLGENGFARPLAPDTVDYFLSAGFLGTTPVDDPAGHLAGLIGDLRDPALRDERGGYGQWMVEKRFGLEAAADSLERMYAEALATAPPVPTRLADAAYLLARSAAGDLKRLVTRQ